MDGLHVAFTGRLGRDAERKYLPNGTPMAKFSVAVSDRRAAAAGEPVEWLSCALFGAECEDLVPQLLKGREVYVEGRLKLDRWQQDGRDRSGLSCYAWTVQPLGSSHAPGPCDGDSAPAPSGAALQGVAKRKRRARAAAS